MLCRAENNFARVFYYSAVYSDASDLSMNAFRFILLKRRFPRFRRSIFRFIRLKFKFNMINNTLLCSFSIIKQSAGMNAFHYVSRNPFVTIPMVKGKGVL